MTITAGKAVPSRRARQSFIPSRRLSSEGVAGIAMVTVLALAFVFVPMLSPYQVTDIIDVPLHGPSAQHLFGTDTLGRDVFVRVFAAGRNNLIIALIGVLISVVVGTFIGTLLGLSRSGWVRAVVLRVVDAVIAIPFVILVLTLVVVLGTPKPFLFLAPGVSTTIFAIVLVGWAPYVRLAVAETVTLRQRESVIAVRLLGYSPPRVVVRHIVPSVIGVCLSFGATQAVLTTSLTASLAFLGAGVQEPTPELGAIMQQGVSFLASAWWIAIFPGFFILLLGIGFALIADDLSE